jgi:hypothetical protein
MAKITGHHFINKPPKNLTRKQLKALKQSNTTGRVSNGYQAKTAFQSDSTLLLPQEKWAANLEFI